MTTEQLIGQLTRDLEQTRRELRGISRRRIILRGRMAYIETLLKSGGACPEMPDPNPPAPRLDRPETIADIAARILAAAGRPMSPTEMAQQAMAEGMVADTLDRARSKIAATVSRDHKRTDATFTHLGRGEIGLVAWRDAGVQSA